MESNSLKLWNELQAANKAVAAQTRKTMRDGTPGNFAEMRRLYGEARKVYKAFWLCGDAEEIAQAVR